MGRANWLFLGNESAGPTAAALYRVSGQAEGLIALRLDMGTINLFLKQLSATLASDVQAVLVWDGAGYHRSHELKCPKNIVPAELSPYSPELNQSRISGTTCEATTGRTVGTTPWTISTKPLNPPSVLLA